MSDPKPQPLNPNSQPLHPSPWLSTPNPETLRQLTEELHTVFLRLDTDGIPETSVIFFIALEPRVE